MVPSDHSGGVPTEDHQNKQTSAADAGDANAGTTAEAPAEDAPSPAAVSGDEPAQDNDAA